MTDFDGYYTLHGLPTGDYRVRACSSCVGMNYIDEYYDGTYLQDEATPVHVDAPGDTSPIDFTLEVGGSISGNVSDGTDPVEGARVEVFDYESISGWWVGYGGVQTGADGSYKIGGLPTGTYGVRVIADGYATEWYDNTYYRDNAIPISVTAPDETSGINFSLEEGGSISGNVSDGTTDIANLWVHVFDYSTNQWLTGSNTDSEGNYVLSGLPTGDYRVSTCSSCVGMNYIDEYYDGTYLQDEATPVHVEAPDDTSGIDFSLELGGTISGIVTDAESDEPIGG